MQPARYRKTPAKLSEPVQRRLNMYALVASAAGVSFLASIQPAEAEIVYTKTNKIIAPNTTALVDLNHDGIVDFKITNTFVSATSNGGGAAGGLFAIPARQHNGVLGHTVPMRGYASAFFANVPIGPPGQFLNGAGTMAATFTTGGLQARNPFGPPRSCSAPWANVSDRYLGLKFEINGQAHFGWARLSVGCSVGVVNATLTGYAYETVADRPILTGKQKGSDEDEGARTQSQSRLEDAAPWSARLGQLAKGSEGLVAWRRK
jgi:hypothetical protein